MWLKRVTETTKSFLNLPNSCKINVHFRLHLGKHKLDSNSHLAGEILRRLGSLCYIRTLVEVLS